MDSVMKAKELRESKYFCHSVDGEVYREGYVFTEEEMAIFWSQLCKEQRELCAKEAEQYPFVSAVRNTPEPEFS